MPVSAKMTVNGINPLRSELEGRAVRATNMRPAFKEVIVAMTNHERRIFETKGASIQRVWEPRKYKYPWPLMRKTNKLYRSLTNKTKAGGAIRVANAHFMEFGTSVPYAKYHQTGTERMGKHMVMRWPLTEVRKYNRIMQDYLAGKKPKGWRRFFRG